MLVYLWIGYDVNIWNTEYIDVFQVVMITIYIALCSILCVLLYVNYKEQYLSAHILPAATTLSHSSVTGLESVRQDLIKQITSRYYGIIVIPQRRAVVIGCMGPDLGPIVLSFLPTDDVVDNALTNVVI